MLEDTGIHAMSIDLRHLNINDSRKVLDYFENIIANDYHVSDDEKLTLTDNNQFYELNIEKGLFVNRKK